MSTENNAAFNSEELDILKALKPEGPDANEPIGQPSDTAGTDPAPAAPEPVAAAPAAATPAPDASAPAASPAAAPAASPAPAAPTAPQGDTRAALRASRHAEKRLRDENQRLAEELEAVKAGKGPVDTSISDEELAQLDEDYPLQAKIVRQQRELNERLARQTAAAPANTEFEPLSYEPEVQEVIDSVPQLVAWQYDPKAQDKFSRAIEYDKALALDPDWKGRPITERFTEAARRSEASLTSSASPSPTPSAAPAASPIDPAAAAANAPVEGPKGISDFRGGAPGHTPAPNYAGMSDDAIMASLPVS